MNDLLTSIEEAKEERQAIQLADGIIPTQEELNHCEIQSVIRRFFPDGKAAAAYFELVEKERGIAPATRLRDDCRKAWAAHRAKVDADKVQK